MSDNRRQFFVTAGALGGAALTALAAPLQAQDKTQKNKPAEDQQKPDEDVGATEDLMREHGVLNRVLLIYEEGLRRIRAKETVGPEVFEHCATLVRKFVEDYHEKLEENFIFPEFEKQKKLEDLVKVLRKQHAAGREVTDIVLRNVAGDQFRKAEARQQLTGAVEQFIRMYRPHEAREDTVLFPAFRKLVTAARLKELGDKFEKEEDRLFGDEGFEKTVDQVAAIEKQLGIHELDQFTPRRK
jgi:hemerythrin-like domain-containing protein